MTVNGKEALGVAEAKVAYEAAWAHAQSCVRWGLVVFAIGAGLWLLSCADWLPESLANSLAGPPDQVGLRGALLVIAGIGLAGSFHSYLDLRAYRLGTERARKLANAASTVFEWLMIAGGVLGIGAILLLIGLIISDWLTGIYVRFPFGAVNIFVTMLVIPLIAPAYTWIERQAKTGLISALIALGALLAAHLTTGAFGVWFYVSVMEQPLWFPGSVVIAISTLAGAALLLWGVVLVVRRLRAPAAQRRGGSALD